MRITDHCDLLYPDAEARQRAAERRKAVADSSSRFLDDLELENISRMISLSGADRFLTLASELSMDIKTIEYRLDCLEDYLNNPELSDELRRIVSELSHSVILKDGEESVNTFYEIKEKMDELTAFMSSIDRINKLGARVSRNIRSSAMKGVFSFFGSLPESEEFGSIDESLCALHEAFSKTIRSVKVGINFDLNMTPDSAGLLEISYDKIYPKGNILEKLVFGTAGGKETFEGEEHLSSLTRHTPADIDTALFRELSVYTNDFAKRIVSALKSYRVSLFSDISEFEHQLDFYEGASAFVKSLRAHGMKMCRPRLLNADKRKAVLKGVFDLSLYKEHVTKAPTELMSKSIVTNDITFDEGAGFYMLTGANNGGKTTFARAVGVCQVMAQAGLYVPAEYAEISLCDNIFTHFPRDEQLGIDTSRFTTEIKDLKAIFSQLTPESLLILNESLQSTTPEECMKIADIHLSLIAMSGVRGLYVTHLTGLYRSVSRLNGENNPTKLDSLVSVADENEQRLYKIVSQPPSGESLAMSIYRQFGATADDIKQSGETHEKS